MSSFFAGRASVAQASVCFVFSATRLRRGLAVAGAREIVTVSERPQCAEPVQTSTVGFQEAYGQFALLK
jgi:hypothetical protein